MPKYVHVEIDLKHLRNLAQTGVRRAELFMGLGLNATNRHDFSDYELNKLPVTSDQASLPVVSLPRGADERTIERYKEQFRVWITSCGLRELLEHYAFMLDQMHHYGLAVAHMKGFMDQLGNPIKLQASFDRLGLIQKLLFLRDRFGVEPEHTQHIAALYHARNSLSHGFGTVRAKEAGEDDKLHLRWLASELWAVGEESGEEFPIGELFHAAKPEQTRIQLRCLERERSYSVGERLTLSGQDLWEICYFFSKHCIPSTLQSFEAFLRKQGVADAR